MRSCNLDKSQYLQLRMGSDYEKESLEKESIGHFLSGAGSVIIMWSCAFDKL